MGNYHHQESINNTSFLNDPDAQNLFARLDYSLKNGKHIQRTESQEAYFRFLEKNYESLKLYYLDFFGVSLESGGEARDKYYYLEFLPDNRGNIPLDNRYFMYNEYVIIGFMLYKIVFIDGYIELNSVGALQRMIRQDYEEFKTGLYKALAKAKKINTIEFDDQKVDREVEKALKEFAKIGWIALDEQQFEILPSFQRLPKIYADYINNPHLWLKGETVS